MNFKSSESSDTTGGEAVEKNSPKANKHVERKKDVVGEDATGHLAIESARYLDAQQDIRTAHDAMCLADAAEMLKISRDKIREDYKSIQSEKGREEVAMSGEDDDTRIHVGNATYNVRSNDPPQHTQVSYQPPVPEKKSIWPYVATAAIAAGLPVSFLGGAYLLSQPRSATIEINKPADVVGDDTWTTIRPYSGEKDGESPGSKSGGTKRDQVFRAGREDTRRSKSVWRPYDGP